jgi:vacuolar-type H+-ATPase subunit F/Vma7
MTALVFIGDEISAAGYRLAGAAVFSPSPSDMQATFETACSQASVVMLTAEAARHIPPARLNAAQTKPEPLVMVIDDIRGRVSAPDLEDHVHTILGLDG